MKKVKHLFAILVITSLICGCANENAGAASEKIAETMPGTQDEAHDDLMPDTSEMLPEAETVEAAETIAETELHAFDDPLCILVVLPEKINLQELESETEKEYADSDLALDIRDQLQSLSVRLETESAEKIEIENALYEMVFYWNDMAVEYLCFSEDQILLNFTADDGYSRYELYRWADSESFLLYLSELLQ